MNENIKEVFLEEIDKNPTKAGIEKTVEAFSAQWYKYNIVKDVDEGGYVVSYPDLPGCMSFGYTEEKAVANGETAKKEWFKHTAEKHLNKDDNEDTEQHDISRPPQGSKNTKRLLLFAIPAIIVLIVCVLLARKAAEDPGAVVPIPDTTDQEQFQFGDAPLYTVSGYNIIEKRFEEYARNYERDRRLYIKGDLVTNEAPVEGGSSETQAYESMNYSLTNTQVKSVDEADIIKTDGKYIYVVTDDFSYINEEDKMNNNISSGIVKIIDVSDPTNPVIASFIMPSANDRKFTVCEIYVKQNNLILICETQKYTENSPLTAWKYYANKNSDPYLCTIVYDISDRTVPKEKGRYYQSGYYISSRLIDNRVYAISDYYVDVHNGIDTARELSIPKCGSQGDFNRVPIDDICIVLSTDATEYAVISSVNFIGDSLNPTVKAVLGGGNNVYCTSDTLYIANYVYDYKLYTEEQLTADEFNTDIGRTEIFAFLLNEGRAEYKNYGTVSGIINDQFSMDEYNGYFRIATTVGWNGYSIVTVLDKNLKRVGELTHIADGEQIYATRFMGNTAYIVTYRNTDPLFVIDLSNPKKPEIKGELHVPGFSSYLHPISDKYILGIGEARDDEGNLIEDTVNIKLSVFDITDPQSPLEIDNAIIKGSSPAEYSHKALCVVPDGSYIIPMNSFSGEDNTFVYKAVRFSVSENGYINILNEYISEYSDINKPLYENDPNSMQYFNNDQDRSVVINNTVFTKGYLFMECFNIDTGEKIGDIELVSVDRLLERTRRDNAMYEYYREHEDIYN